MSRGRDLVVGVDLGGTNMQAAVVDAQHAILGRHWRESDPTRGSDAVFDDVAASVHEACADASVTIDDVRAIGVAAAGAIDAPRGVVLEAPNMYWTNVPLRDELQRRLPRPVVIENDVNAAVWGEWFARKDEEQTDLLGVWLGTGVGGGLVIDRRIYYGDAFTGGEIGHVVVAPDGPPGFRKVEDLCSRGGICRTLHARRGEFPPTSLPLAPAADAAHFTNTQLFEAYQAGDGLTVAVIDRAAALLGVAIAGWVTVLALDRVVIGGGVMETFGDVLMQKIRGQFDADVFPPQRQACRFLMTELRDRAGLIGAASVARAGLD